MQRKPKDNYLDLDGLSKNVKDKFNSNITQEDVTTIIKLAFDEIINIVACDRDVEIANIGVFYLQHHKAHPLPKRSNDGEIIMTKPYKRLMFSCSYDVRERLGEKVNEQK